MMDGLFCKRRVAHVMLTTTIAATVVVILMFGHHGYHVKYTQERTMRSNLQEMLGISDVISDDVISEIIGLNEITSANANSYAVFSAKVDDSERSLNSLFYLPLTALAWKRINYGSIVALVGPADRLFQDDVIGLVVSRLRQLGAIVILLEPRPELPEQGSIIGPVSRLFVANIIRSRSSSAALIDDIYVITGDTDVWPIDGAAYRLPVGKGVLSLNAYCCGYFEHNGLSYRMLPLSGIGMKIKTWHQVTHRFGHSPETVDEIMSLLVREFGSVILDPNGQGDDVGLSSGQRLISVLASDLNQTSRNMDQGQKVAYVGRHTDTDRIDRSRWHSWTEGTLAMNDGGRRIDARLPVDGFKSEVWTRILPLVRALHRNAPFGCSERFLWTVKYVEDFQKLLRSRDEGRSVI